MLRRDVPVWKKPFLLVLQKKAIANMYVSNFRTAKFPNMF